MLRSKRKFLFLLLCISFCGAGYAQGITNSNLALDLGFSARQVSLGQSSYSTRTNGFDPLGNPALLAETNYQNIGFTHNNYFRGLVKSDQLMFGFPVKNSDYSVAFFGYRIQNTLGFNTLDLLDASGSIDFGAIKKEENNDFGLKMMLAKHVRHLNMDIGLSFSIDVPQVTSFSSATAFGLDLGLTKNMDDFTALSIVLENAIGKYYFWSQNVSLLDATYFQTNNYVRLNSTAVELPYLRAGFNRFLYQSDKIVVDASLSVGLGYGKFSSSLLGFGKFNFDPSLGVETQVFNYLFVRLGLSADQLIDGKMVLNPSLGLGLHYKKFKFDYAYTDFTESSLALQKHVVSLNLNIHAENKTNLLINRRRF